MGSTNKIEVSKMIDKDMLIKGRQKQWVQKKEKAEEKLEIINSEADALNDIIRLGKNLNSALANLAKPAGGPFDVKAPQIVTSDQGEGEDYFKTKIRDTAIQREYDIKIISKVQFASAKLELNGGGAIPLADAQLDGTLTLKIAEPGGDVELEVDVYNGDSLADIVHKINDKIAAPGLLQTNPYMSYEAVLIQDSSVKDADGNNVGGYIEVRAKNGEKRNITLDWDDSGTPGANSLQQKGAAQPFAQAKISVDGIEITSDTNEFKEVVPGIDITATKVNHGGQGQTLNIVGDATAFAKPLGDFVNSVNAISAFVQSQDPDNLTEDGNNPPLANSPEVRSAKRILEHFFGGYGEMKLKEIGLGVTYSSDTSHPSGTKVLEVVNQTKLKEALEDMGSLKKLFVSSAEVVQNGATSELSFTMATEKLPVSLDGQEFDLRVNINAGAVNTVKAIMQDGTEVEGKFENGYISFERGKLLHGMRFRYNINGAADGDEDFKVTYNSGLLSDAKVSANSLVDENGNGLAKLKLDKVVKNKTAHQKDLSLADEKISEVADAVERMISMLKVKEKMANIMMKGIESMND